MVGGMSARRVGGVAGVVGGVAFAGYTIVQARLPEGCVASECDTRPLRPSSTTANTLLAIGLLLIAACGLTLLGELHAQGRLGRMGTLGGSGLGAGFALLAAAGVAGRLTNSEWSGMPLLVVPGVTALAVGLLALGVAVLRSRLLPAWTAILLVIGAALLPFGNEENSTILRDVPFGLSWVVVGVLLAGGAVRRAPQPARVAQPAP